MLAGLENGIDLITSFVKKNGFLLVSTIVLKQLRSQRNSGTYYFVMDVNRNPYQLPSTDILVQPSGRILAVSSGIQNLVSDPELSRYLSIKQSSAHRLSEKIENYQVQSQTPK